MENSEDSKSQSSLNRSSVAVIGKTSEIQKIPNKLNNLSSHKKRKDEEINTESGQKARITRAINEFKVDSKNTLENCKNSLEIINRSNNEITAIQQRIEELQKNIEEKTNDIKIKYENLLNLNNEIFVSTEERKSIKDKITEAESEIVSASESVQEKRTQFDEYYVKIFGSEDENGEVTVGLEKEIEDKNNRLEELYKVEGKKYTALFKKIEGLLPGATSAGLAAAFQQQKRKYQNPDTFWSVVFVITMIVMISFGYKIASEAVALGPAISPSLVLSKILARTPLLIGIIWLGVFSSKQQSQNKRLGQEYAHKESVSSSYEGFKRQIDNLGQTKENKILSVELLRKVINAIEYNPSTTLDNASHREDPPFINKLLSLWYFRKIINTDQILGLFGTPNTNKTVSKAKKNEEVVIEKS
jgi:hypothetical protein